jgi:hypothetical protein
VASEPHDRSILGLGGNDSLPFWLGGPVVTLGCLLPPLGERRDGEKMVDHGRRGDAKQSFESTTKVVRVALRGDAEQVHKLGHCKGKALNAGKSHKIYRESE